ncbi:GNAT family N-acetyltransferase [Paenibacillus sp. Marseille-Q4541]|uniref:GNAT family N-acetyltransferase n=1 Tax=Paenibacillus sp. Marseille-Q4541 TaxID=2831522 RepID=UPI001BAB4998|nr:GNAT family N-acetyltransferase [Paenibacillus sp. Marseille-Q4541]
MSDIQIQDMRLSDLREQAEDYEHICRKLYGYNVRATNGLLQEPGQSIHLYLKNPDSEVVGGIFCESWLYGLYIDVLWISEDYRNAGYGRQMLLEAERRGKEIGCLFAHTSTFSYQAPSFYEKNGYEIYGVNDAFPQNIKQYYLKKQL